MIRGKQKCKNMCKMCSRMNTKSTFIVIAIKWHANRCAFSLELITQFKSSLISGKVCADLSDIFDAIFAISCKYTFVHVCERVCRSTKF